MEKIKIKNIKKVSEDVDVYDIQNFEDDVFQNEPNFIIDDILAHNCGRHAGGVVILQEPIWKFIPVVHTKDGIATAFTESGSAAELDELGVIKYDFLAITVLETISNAVDMINEELVKIEDDDGTIKIVPRSYLDTLEASAELNT